MKSYRGGNVIFTTCSPYWTRFTFLLKAPIEGFGWCQRLEFSRLLLLLQWCQRRDVVLKLPRELILLSSLMVLHWARQTIWLMPVSVSAQMPWATPRPQLYISSLPHCEVIDVHLGYNKILAWYAWAQSTEGFHSCDLRLQVRVASPNRRAYSGILHCGLYS